MPATPNRHPLRTTTDPDREDNPYLDALARLAEEAVQMYATVRRAENAIGDRRRTALASLSEQIDAMTRTVHDAERAAAGGDSG